MKTHKYLVIVCSISMLSFMGCQSESKGDPSLDAWGPDTLTTQDNTQRQVGSSTTHVTEGSQKKLPSRNTPSSEEASKAGDASSGVAGDKSSTGGILNPVGPSGNRWWDNRTVFFIDWVGGAGDIVHEAVIGQRYFPETKIFIYCTDKAMEGTMNHTKTELTLKETELDDRIFIWVHLDDNRKPLFVKTLISDNIKNKIASAPLTL